jgi:hypothetical protein
VPYGCDVVRKAGLVVVLDVEAEQPDCEPYYQGADFALGLLLGGDDDLLRRTLGRDAEERLADGTLDPTPFVRRVSARVERRGSVARDVAPVVRYEIEVTDARFIAHLAVGSSHDSYAWSETGSSLDDALTFEPSPRIAVGDFRVGDRVSRSADLPVGPGSRHGRGRIVETTTCPIAPTWWEGGRRVHLVELDHGPDAWMFAESLRPVPDDTYERAWARPNAFFADLLTRSPLERARALRFLGLFGGGSILVPPDASRPFEVRVEGVSARLFGLLRRLSFEDAVRAGLLLLAAWQSDPEARAARFAVPTKGTELASGEEIPRGHYECCTPTFMVLGALTLIFAEHGRRAPAPLAARAIRVFAMAAPHDLRARRVQCGSAALRRAPRARLRERREPDRPRGRVVAPELDRSRASVTRDADDPGG